MIQKGGLVALALAGLFAAGGCGQDKKAEGSSGAVPAHVKCMGVNECAGHGGCKTASNECKGKNGCKGKGFVETSSDDCASKGGKPM